MEEILSGHSPIEGMSQLMTLQQDQPLWLDSEMADLLRHQLAAPVVADLAQCDAIGGKTLCEIQDMNAGTLSFAQVLFAPAPSLLLLQAIKKFGKLASQQNVGLPTEIALTLYYLAILAALLRHDQRISGKDDAKLRKIARQVAAQPWAEEGTRTLCLEAIAKLKGS